MEASHLIWKEENRKDIFHSPVFSVRDTECRSPEGKKRVFTIIDAPDWVITVPLIRTEGGLNFLMVRQWRHGSQELSLEFPGGVIEKGESPEAGAARELEEETAYRAGKLSRLGDMSPNPAVMSNRVHYYLAEDLSALGGQRLDEDEFVDAEIIPVAEVIRAMGRPPYVHALSAAALALYLSLGA
ncbi:MAG: NUDIX hydrolase [Treponema sp.]|jgi:8-oxo-dGTP pyrophosphatase MutT (NUDIX family)|nr:NUDIX hydrolase [Treponema sp.]